MNIVRQILITAFATFGAILVVFAPNAHAKVDDQLSLVDGRGRTMTIQQVDTSLEGVYPMDRNRLTREWFHSARAIYTIVGEEADEFEGQIVLGYQVGFPWSLGVGMNFSYTTPNVLIDGSNLNPMDPDFNPLQYGLTPSFFPGASISSDLGNGPGIQEVATFSANVHGSTGNVLVSNAHGTITGAAGVVLVRPFARLISSDGDSVTTFGAQWSMK